MKCNLQVKARLKGLLFPKGRLSICYKLEHRKVAFVCNGNVNFFQVLIQDSFCVSSKRAIDARFICPISLFQVLIIMYNGRPKLYYSILLLNICDISVLEIIISNNN